MTLDIRTIAPSELHEEMLRLKTERQMDFLVNLVGMDWGEEGLGVIYMLESTRTGETATLKTVTADRENPFIPTVSDLWQIANIYEREVYDFFGIKFWNHPICAASFCAKIGWVIRSARMTRPKKKIRSE